MRNNPHRAKHILFKLCQQFINLDADDENENAESDHEAQNPELRSAEKNIVDIIHNNFDDEF